MSNCIEVGGCAVVERPRRRLMVSAVLAGTAVAMTIGLEGCFPLAVTAVAAGTYAATDRRSLGAQADDKVIPIKIDNRLSAQFPETGHININCFNHKVLLTGEVPGEAVKVAAERAANGVESVTGVVNELIVAGSSSLSSRSSDLVITTEIKARLIDSKDIFGNAFKVVCERGTVYLMGRVTRREGDRAGEIASGVGGVQKVIKLFDYITEEELKQMTLQPASTTP